VNMSMRIALLALTLIAANVSAARPAVAQVDHFQWSGTVAQGKTIDVRGLRGSIRTISSDDDAIHVDARRSDPSSARIDVVENPEGVIICVVYSTLEAERRQSACQPGSRAPDVQTDDVRVDFVVRVPAGVRFAGSTVNGDITVERLRSEVSVATINGGVNIQTTDFATQATTINGDVVLELPAAQDAEFHANTVSGTIDADFPLQLISPPFLPAGGPTLPRPQIVRTTIGNGGPELRVTTVNGNIRLRRR
jgi:hypothetical protein